MDLVPSSSTNDDDAINCPCHTQKDSFMIQCDKCNIWYHGPCVNLSEDQAWYIDQFFCSYCRHQNVTLRWTLKRLCWTPSCIEVAGKNSNYCNWKCGLKYVMPNTQSMSREEMESPSNISRFAKALRNRLEVQDAKIIQLILMVQRSQNSPADTVWRTSHIEDNDISMSCKLCQLDCTVDDYYSHLGKCFKSNPILTTDGKTRVDNIQWNILCNHGLDGNSFCRQMRVLCTEHYRSDKGEDAICGFPLEMDLGATLGTFCGYQKNNCTQHPYHWEELRRAEFDLDKLHILLNLSELEKLTAKIRKAAMKRRRVASESEQDDES